MKKIGFIADKKHRGLRLDAALAPFLSSKGHAKKLIDGGSVYLNNKRVRIASKKLIPGAQVIAYYSENPVQVAEEKEILLTETDILYEDQDLIAVNKPPNLPTQPTVDSARANLFSIVKDLLIKRGSHKFAYVGLHHRLDKDTSGVVLMTKSRRANEGVAKLFSERLMKKTYFSVVDLDTAPPAEKKFTVKNYLAKDMDFRGKKTKFRSVKSGGSLAVTHVSIVKINLKKKLALVEAIPKTGRTHQIRVHLSEKGMPVHGDALYGKRSSEVSRSLLHAGRLEFIHPLTKKKICIDSPLPIEFGREF